MVVKMKYSRFNSTQNLPYDHQFGYSNTEKFLKKEIDFLLAPSASQLNAINFNDIYIPVPEAEKFLEEALHFSFSDRIKYLTGLTGSGKSMVLKKVFQTHSMTPIIYEQTLIIPLSFDNFIYSGEKSVDHEKCISLVFENMINCACELLEKTFSTMKLAELNEHELFSTIKNNRGDYSQSSRTWPRPTINKRIQNLLQENAIAFYTSLLKYYLNQDECKINNVAIIVDDIEGAGEKCELLPVITAYRTLTCLENTPRAKKWSVNLVISCRNYVYRLIIDDKFSLEHQRFETYPECEKIHLDNPPSISDIVKKRYSAIIQQGGQNKSEKWRTALDIVVLLLQNIDSSIGGFILNLKIRNIRKALALTKRIIYNKKWIQRDYSKDISGAFTIDNFEEYDIQPASLMRAIGMGESLIYFSDYSDIPNILYNENQTDLYILLVIKYCLERQDSHYSNWENTIDLEIFYKRINSIFDNEDLKNNFQFAVKYLILNRLLLRSIDQLQDNTLPVNENNVEHISKVYISNAAVDLWDWLGKSSVLMEMYMDDLWLDNSQRPTQKHQYRGFDKDNYSIAVDYLEILFEKEIKIRNQADNLGMLDYYVQIFGEDLISKHLINGLNNSLKAFFKESYYNQPEMEKITKLKKLMENYLQRKF